ncbi:hypothetical protein GYMLUDRAFT_247849 [Collybiopsis luxurians FD-317 M1]|uniref:DUF6533 domain-containing protein n=1 Tax=Collybiopsis luxurians FD-317 M1 TaxID=944289 RepID=A0A0D0CMA6_9AGAR|nr:hypothetical protein GYMLUDRAFT_247849 [Collybiopsis luxurians FD-317 M1]
MDSTYAQPIPASELAWVQDYPYLLSTTLLYWDYFLTISEEVQYFWKRPVRITTVLFFLNRYVSVLGNIVTTILKFLNPVTETQVRKNLIPNRYTEEGAAWEAVFLYDFMLFVMTLLKAYKTHHELRSLRVPLADIIIRDGSWYFGVMAFANAVNQYLNILLLLTVRVYALYNRSKRMLGVMLSTAGILVILSLFAILFGRSEENFVGAPDIGCHTELSFIPSVQVAAAWEALFLYDSMLFVMTLLKAYKTQHELRPLMIPLLDIIIRDGSWYFGVMAFANAINISTFYAALVSFTIFKGHTIPLCQQHVCHDDVATHV